MNGRVDGRTDGWSCKQKDRKKDTDRQRERERDRQKGRYTCSGIDEQKDIRGRMHGGLVSLAKRAFMPSVSDALSR